MPREFVKKKNVTEKTPAGMTIYYGTYGEIG
jgi:hypothetical protein